MTRRALLLVGFALLFAVESFHFTQRGAADLMRLRARRAFFNQDYSTALRRYRTAQRWGGDENALATGLVEMFLFVIGQFDAGAIKVDLPMPRKEAADAAHAMIARLIESMPYNAYYWSLASQSYLIEARRQRITTPIRISALSSEPLGNLRPADRLGVAALEVATRLEPNNATFHDALVEVFLDAGSPAAATDPCRRAVASFPVLSGHGYLSRAGLPPAIVEAAVLGFEDAAGRESMIPRAVIEMEAGAFLAERREDGRAAVFLERATRSAPELFDAQYRLGYVLYRLRDYPRALEHLEKAIAILPGEAAPFLYVGLTHLALGDLESAIAAFTEARERRPGVLQFFRKLGETLEQAGRIEEAERQFVAAANLHPKSDEAWIDLLMFHVRRADSRGALDVCARARAHGIDSQSIGRQCAALERAPR